MAAPITIGGQTVLTGPGNDLPTWILEHMAKTNQVRETAGGGIMQEPRRPMREGCESGICACSDGGSENLESGE